MKIVIFGLTISSSWGNGHATLWRGLCQALARDKHRVIFFEKNTPYYIANRDLFELQNGNLHFYDDWNDVITLAKREITNADAVVITSYCPDAIQAGELIFSNGRPISIFYDLDTPVTLSQLAKGKMISYIGKRGLRDFDLVLSYTGGAALDALQTKLGAKRVAPLYGHVDPDQHKCVLPRGQYRCDLSYLGTYSPDRQESLSSLFIRPAEKRCDMRFVIGGALYPQDFPWSSNIYYVRHLPPSEHPAFFSSSRLTLNVTRKPMAEMGWCPSGRLFEAAACGTAILSDSWQGLDAFFKPEEEIIVASNTDEAIVALDMDDAEIRRVALAAREHVMAAHTSRHRANEFVAAINTASSVDLQLERV